MKFVVPVKFEPNPLPAVNVLVSVLIWIAASGPMVTDTLVVPVGPNWAWAVPVNASSRQPSRKRTWRCCDLGIFILSGTDPEDHLCRI